VWRFKAVNKPGKRPPKADSFTESLPVPGVWECSLEHANHRGFGWYQRDFRTPEGAAASVRIVFGAAAHTAKVWLDGKLLGEHYGAHTEFEFVCPGIKAGAHTVTALVDNRYGPHNPLAGPDQDIFTWGGLPRSVHFEILPEVFIASASALPRKGHRGWELHCQVTLRSLTNAALPDFAMVLLEGAETGRIEIDDKGDGRAVLRVKDVELWSPENPRLYTVAIRAGEDMWQERIGFRTVTIKGRKILLNGKPIVLQGVNRHEFHPDFGPALPAGVHVRDIEILKRLGANFVRGSHYPNDPLFLDMCDENGILFWEELSHWGCTAEEMRAPAFLSRSLEQTDEMVLQHQHHPSIIMWGMLNEAHTDTAIGRRMVKAVAGRLRKLDPTRPITFASNRIKVDRCFDLVDIVSINIYPGWYGGDLSTLDDNLRDMLATVRRRSHGKPVILSEFGAGATPGSRSFELRKWTEGYQTELLRRVIEAAQQSRFVSGVAIWQYCDTRTSPAIWFGRPREYNNKGIVTEYRQPKQAFRAVAEQFGKPWAIVGGK